MKTLTEMESHEEKLHKMIIQSKINDTKDVMKRKAMEIDKVKVDRHGGGRGGGGMGGGMGGGGWAASASGGSESGRGDGPNDASTRAAAPAGTAAPRATSGARGGTGSSARDAVSRPAGPSKGLVLGGGASRTSSWRACARREEAVELEPSAARGAAAGPGAPSVPREGVSLQIEEKITCSLKKTVGWESMELQGTMMLEIKGGEEDAFIRVAVATGRTRGQFKTRASTTAMHAAEGVLGLKDPARPFPMGSPLGILKWRYQTRDETKVPLSINAGTSVSGVASRSIEYEATDAFDLHNVVISIPLPPLRDPRGEPGGRRLHLRQPEARAELGGADDEPEQSEQVHGVCGAATDGDNFFPIGFDFSSNATRCDVKVDTVMRTTDGGAVKFFGESKLVCDGYSVV